MKTNITLSVLVVLFVVWLSPVFAEEVLVNNQTGEVEVRESNPWRQASGVEVEAYQNPQKEIPVWSSNHWTKIDFFHKGLVKTATNVVVYRDGKIYPLEKTAVESGSVIFLWYKFLLVMAVLLMLFSNIAFKWDWYKFAIVVAIVAIVTTLVAAFAAFTIAEAALAFVAFVAALVAFFSALFDDEVRRYRLLLAIFYILALVAMIV